MKRFFRFLSGLISGTLTAALFLKGFEHLFGKTTADWIQVLSSFEDWSAWVLFGIVVVLPVLTGVVLGLGEGSFGAILFLPAVISLVVFLAFLFIGAIVLIFTTPETLGGLVILGIIGAASLAGGGKIIGLIVKY